MMHKTDKYQLLTVADEQQSCPPCEPRMTCRKGRHPVTGGKHLAARTLAGGAGRGLSISVSWTADSVLQQALNDYFQTLRL